MKITIYDNTTNKPKVQITVDAVSRCFFGQVANIIKSVNADSGKKVFGKTVFQFTNEDMYEILVSGSISIFLRKDDFFTIEE